MGCHVNPTLSFYEVSGFSGFRPNARATGSLTGNVLFSNGTPPINSSRLN